MNMEFYEQVVEEFPNPIVVFEPTGTASYANRAALKVFGSRAGELKAGKYNLFEEPFIKEINADGTLQRALQGESVFFPEVRATVAGNVVYREVSVFPIMAVDGSVARLVAVTGDITERVETKAKLAESFEACKRMTNSTIMSLSRIIELRDPYTAGHQARVSELACAIATEMGISEVEIDRMKIAGLVHDLGKILLPSEILSKPGALTDYEYAIIKKHPEAGLSVIENTEFDQVILDIVYQHHERIDGSGYPMALKGSSITREARIFAVADVVEAMAAHRPYRQSLGIESALREIETNRGILFDTEVVDVCLDLFRNKGFVFTEVANFYPGQQ